MRKINVFKIIFFTSFIVCIVLSIVLNKKDLIYIVPLVLFTLAIFYISEARKKSNPLYLVSLGFVTCTNVLSFLDYDKYLNYITISASVYITGFTLILKKYLNKGQFKKFLSLPVFITSTFIVYLFYTIMNNLTNYISNTKLLFTTLCTVSLIVHLVTIAVIYLSDKYKNGITLLTSGILLLVQLSVSIMNQYLYFNKTFTVLITLTHFTSLYLYTRFILKPIEFNLNDSDSDSDTI